ncbi:MAG: hypothetical protein U0441_30035 [Polyangiaceae bacterium]
MQVVGLDDMIAVSANDHHTMALKSDGTVWGWGENYYHQLGNDTVGDHSPTPVQALGIGGIVAVAAGDPALDGVEERWHGVGLGRERQQPARRR